MKVLLILVACCCSFYSNSQTGPGGVGTTDGASSLKIWYHTTGTVSTSGSSVNGITNAAGITALNISENGSQRPTLLPSALNGYDVISFNGNNRLRTGLTLNTTNFITNEASSFVVNKADNTTQTSSLYTTDPLNSNRFSNHIPWSGTVYFDIGTCCGSASRISVSGLSGLNDYSFWSYDANMSTGKQLYRNGALLNSISGSDTFTSHGNYRFNIGANTSGSNGYQGDLTEIIIFNKKVNTAQRIIIENYLAAKYGLPSAGNDLYTMDNPSNGHYDFDVAGIGRINSTNQHTSAQGTGIIQIQFPTNLNDNEFLFWGHDNAPLLFSNTTDVPSQSKSRLRRTWRVSEITTSGTATDVGGIEMRFDVSSIPFLATSNLQLLVDTDNDGQFSDEYPISGILNGPGTLLTITNTIALENEMRFTLGIAKQNVITNKRVTFRVNQN